jgi:hypothetical protein
MIFGCLCDSGWDVGLGYGQVQEPEWFGPDCAMSEYSMPSHRLQLSTYQLGLYARALSIR